MATSQVCQNVIADTVTLANGQSLSPVVDLNGKTLLAVVIPSGWTAAAMTFQGSSDNITFFDIYITTGEYASGTMAASQAVVVDPTVFLAFRYLKIRSGTGASPVSQVADRILTLISRLLQQ